MIRLPGGPVEFHCPKLRYRDLTASFPDHLSSLRLEEGELLTEHLCQRAAEGPLCPDCRGFTPDYFRQALIAVAVYEGAFEVAARHLPLMEDPERVPLSDRLSLEVYRNDRSLLPYLEEVARQGLEEFDNEASTLLHLSQGLHSHYPYLSLLLGLAVVDRCDGFLPGMHADELKQLARDLDVPGPFQRVARVRRRRAEEAGAR